MSKKKHKTWEGDGKNNHDYYEWTNYVFSCIGDKRKNCYFKRYGW